MNKKKTLIILALLGMLTVSCCNAQSKYGGFIADSTSYIVISQPSAMTAQARLVDNDISRFPFLKIDNYMLLLSNDTVEDVSAFRLPNEIQGCEDIFIIDTIIICKVSNIIKQYDGEKVADVMIMPDDNYNIYPADYGYIYLVKHDKDTSCVMLLETNTRRYVTLFKTPFHVENLVGNGHECYITAGLMIFYFTENDYVPIVVGESRIQSLATYEGGVFYSTQKACYFMGEKGKSYPFLLGDIKQLMLINNRLYLLFRDGLLSVFDNADGYRKLLEEVTNEQN